MADGAQIRHNVRFGRQQIQKNRFAFWSENRRFKQEMAVQIRHYVGFKSRRVLGKPQKKTISYADWPDVLQVLAASFKRKAHKPQREPETGRFRVCSQFKIKMDTQVLAAGLF